MKKNMAEFRINVKKLFLTYPQVSKNLNHELVLKQLKEKLSIEDYIIALEMHEDGSPHYHILLVLSKRCDIKISSYLDLKDQDNNVFHGKYEKVKNFKNAIKYVVKENNFITNMRLPIYKGNFIQPEEFVIHQAREKGEIEALNDYIKDYPERLTKYLSILKRTLKNIREIENAITEEEIPVEVPYDKIDFSNIKQAKELKEWVDADKKETLVLTGKSGTGKTTWALSFCKEQKLKTLYITDFEGFKNLKNKKKDAWILDDANLAKITKITGEALTKLIDNSTQADLRLLGQSLKRPRNMIQIIITNNLSSVIKKLEKRVSRRIRIINFDKPIILNIENLHLHYHNNQEREFKNKEIWIEQNNDKNLLEE